MIIFNYFNSKKKIALITLVVVFLSLIVSKNYLIELSKSPTYRVHLVNIAKIVIPLKNNILMRSVDDKISLLKSSGSCVFCDLTQGNFKGADIKGVDLRYANLSGANLSNSNLSGANFYYANFQDANLQNADLSYTSFNKTNLIRSNLSGVDLSRRDLRKLDLSQANLTNTNLTGSVLLEANLSQANFSNTALIYADLSGANLSGVDLRNVDLTGANLSGVDLSNMDLTGTILKQTNLTGANLNGVDLRSMDLTGSNLSGVDLSNMDLTGTILTQTNLTGVNLNGVDLRSMDLTGSNLSGVDLSNMDLTDVILKDAKKIEISINNSIWPALDKIQNLNVIRYDLSGELQYLATKDGFLFELKDNESTLVLDLNKNVNFFTDSYAEGGLLDIVSKNKLVYVSYTNQDINGVLSLVVDEYSMNFTKVRNIIKIEGFSGVHFAGNLFFDSFGELYLSVGDGEQYPDKSKAQSLNNLLGKILRLDVSALKLEPEIIVYGVRNPWGVTVDSKDRMFILQCGNDSVEAVYLLNDLYSGIPANLGFPVFEGGIKLIEESLNFNEILAPIFQYNNRPGCATAGVYLDDIESLLIGDFYGTLRLLRQKENDEWYLLHENNQQKGLIWDFSLDKNTKKIFVAPLNVELEIFIENVE